MSSSARPTSHNSVGYFISLTGHGTGAPRSDRLVCFNFTGTVPNTVPSTAEVSVDYNGALSANRRRVRILQANGTFRNMLVSELGPSTNTFYILRATSNSWDLVARTWTPSAAADFAGQVFRVGSDREHRHDPGREDSGPRRLQDRLGRVPYRPS